MLKRLLALVKRCRHYGVGVDCKHVTLRDRLLAHLVALGLGAADEAESRGGG